MNFGALTFESHDELIDFDYSMLKQIEICYRYNELFETDEYSVESLTEKIKDFSKNSLQFLVKLIDKCIAKFRVLLHLMRNSVYKIRKVLKQTNSANSKNTNSKTKNEQKLPPAAKTPLLLTSSVDKEITYKSVILDLWEQEIVWALSQCHIHGDVNKVEIDFEQLQKKINSINQKYYYDFNHNELDRYTCGKNYDTSMINEVCNDIAKLVKTKDIFTRALKVNAEKHMTAQEFNEMIQWKNLPHFSLDSDNPSPETVKLYFVYCIKWADLYQHSLMKWLVCARRFLALINVSKGGTGNKGVIQSFTIPQEVKTELGKYFGKYHDQGQNLPLKANKIVIVSEVDDTYGVQYTKTDLVGVSLSICLKSFDAFTRILLHELVHVSQNNRNRGNLHRTWKRYNDQLSSNHDDRFVEKQADKAAAQFVHDVNHGVISSDCATCRWIRDVRQKVKATIKRNNITYISRYDKSDKKVADRMEANRTDDIKEPK